MINTKKIINRAIVIAKDHYSISREEILKMSKSELDDFFCDYFAEAFIELYPKAEYKTNDDYGMKKPHAFVLYKDKFYDVNSLKGVRDVKHLNINK